MKYSIFSIFFIAISLLSSSCVKTCDPAIPDTVKNFDISLNSNTQEKCSIYSATANTGANPAIAISFKPSINPDSKYPYGVVRIELTNYKNTGVIPILPLSATVAQLIEPYCTVTFVGDHNDPNEYAYQCLTGEVKINKIDDVFDVSLTNCGCDKRTGVANAPSSFTMSGNMSVKIK